MLNRQKNVQFFNSLPCFFSVNFIDFFLKFGIPYGVIIMIQRYITFLEKQNFLHTIFYTFLLIFINVLHKLLKYNKLTYMLL